MATDFWSSSHYKRWIVDRATLKQARADDLLYVADPEHLAFLSIYFADLITKLGKKLSLRQRVIATATVFFRRFYLKNSYCETDPYLVLSACCYVAAKAEESPVHIKTMVGDSRIVFGQDPYNMKTFPTDNSKLAEMEFYLVDDLECDLVVFHPYRTLLALCKKESANGYGTESLPDEAEAGELGTGIGAEDGPRYWGTGEGKLELSEAALQYAWFIINDTYRSDLCLLYPPHLIAITAIYLTLVLHTPTQNSIAPLLPNSSAFNPSISSSSSTISSDSPNGSGSGAQTTSHLRRSRSTRNDATPSSSTTPRKSPAQHGNHHQQDPIAFLADINVSLSTISTIAQEIISMYSLWNRYRESATIEEIRNSYSKLPPPITVQSQHNSPYHSQPSEGAGGWRMGHSQPHLYQTMPPQLYQSPAKRSAPGSIRSRTGARGNSASGSGSGSGTPDWNGSGDGGSRDDLFGSSAPGSPASQQGSMVMPNLLGAGAGMPSISGSVSASVPGHGGGDSGNNTNPWRFGEGPIVTPFFLSVMLIKMREARLNDMAPSGRPVVVNRMLERTGRGGG